MNHDAYSDSYIRAILGKVKTIAMVGASPLNVRPSYFAFKYLLERGYRMLPVNPGQAGIYQNGAIHSIDYPDYAKFVRVTGTNLDNINRMRVDLKTGEVHQMTPQQAT